MDDLLNEFLTETRENLEHLDMEIVQLEQDPNPELLSSIFRMMHTIKGTCGFLALPRLEHVAHAAENVLGKIRDGELAISPQAVSMILEAIDQIKFIVAVLEENSQEPEGDDKALIASLNALATGAVGGAAPAAAAPSIQTQSIEAPAAASPAVATLPEPFDEDEPAPVSHAAAAPVSAPRAAPPLTPPGTPPARACRPRGRSRSP